MRRAGLDQHSSTSAAVVVHARLPPQSTCSLSTQQQACNLWAWQDNLISRACNLAPGIGLRRNRRWRSARARHRTMRPQRGLLAQRRLLRFG